MSSCPSCATAIAVDQRYCLNCGARVGERRLDPAALLRSRRRGEAGAASAPPEFPGSLEPGMPGERWSPRTLAGSCLGLLVGGALIGAALAPGPAGSLAAAASQVVVVTSPVVPEPEPADSPSATFAPSGPPIPVAPAPAEPAAPVATAPVVEPEAPDPLPPAPPKPPAKEPPENPSIGHVFLVVLPGGPGAEAAFAPDAPESYLRGLVPRGQLLTEYAQVGASGLANRLALVSGQEPTPDSEADCPAYERCLYPAETKTLADQLSTWGFEWRAYVEGMEEPCRRPDPANPFVYFHSVVDLADCSRKALPLDRMPDQLRKPKETAVFNLVAPASDQELERWVDPILDSRAFKKDGLVVVLFDRAPDALVISPFVKADTTNDRPYDTYSLLKTIEDRIGLGEHLGHAHDEDVRAFGRDVFDTELDPLQEPEATVAAHERRRP
jgi:phosphatidylinositol-3-phosphatase